MHAHGPTRPEERGPLPTRPRRRASAWRAPRAIRWRLPDAHVRSDPAVAKPQAGAFGPALALLGAPRVRVGTTWHELPPGRWLALLAYVARCGSWVRREVLAAMFWPEQDRERAYLNLRQTLQTIARSPAGAAFEREPARVCWRGVSDVAAFEAHVRAGSWSTAVAAYGGPFVDGLELTEVTPAQEWLDAERQSLEDWWRTGVLALAGQHLKQGHPLDALALADRLVRRDPIDEAAVRVALESAVASGDRQRAQRAYASLRGMLETELGMEPEEETVALAVGLGLAGAR